MVQRAVRLPPATPLELPPLAEDFDDGPDAADAAPEVGEPAVGRGTADRRASIAGTADRARSFTRPARAAPAALKPIPFPNPIPFKPVAASAEAPARRTAIEAPRSASDSLSESRWPCGPNEDVAGASARLREQLDALRAERRPLAAQPPAPRSISAPTLERGAIETTAPDWLIRDIEKPAAHARGRRLRPIVIGLGALVFACGGAAVANYVKGTLNSRLVTTAAVAPVAGTASINRASAAGTPVAGRPATDAPVVSAPLAPAPAANSPVTATPPVTVARVAPSNAAKAAVGVAPTGGVAIAPVDAKPRTAGTDDPGSVANTTQSPSQTAALGGGTRSFRTVETTPRLVTTVPVTQPASGIANTATLPLPTAATTTQAAPVTQPATRATATLVPADPPRASTQATSSNKTPSLLRAGTSSKTLTKPVATPKQRTGPRSQSVAVAAPAKAAPADAATADTPAATNTGVLTNVISFFSGNTAASGTAVASSDVKIHAGPASKTASIGVLKAGTAVPAAAGCTGWCQVTVNGKTGWVYHTFLNGR